ncbi:Ig-like domain-containing protein [Sinomonas sp. JGH33]|uniref:Ig-like domain-containing protein n=1 Tax=Sinomonas terricola TaxID=3110330 RepID=A0ABU5T949_9MICC|nr:Ig-like domain-containing protein [Sinomonas sp. JGH33]MEA5456193.1 Ig-like domain-containing protein [Sinomonas sp. JGH33]
MQNMGDVPGTRKRSRVGKIVALVAVLAVAGLGGTFAAVGPLQAAPIGSEATTAVRSQPGTAFPVVKPATTVTTPVAGAKEVNPAAPVTVTVTNGTLDNASLRSSSGQNVDGTLNPEKTVWTSSGQLAFNSTYTLSYTSLDSAGRTSTATSTFATVATANEADAAMYPLDGMSVGVAQPIQLTFSEPVKNKKAVEKAITVTSTSGQAGAFHWFSDTMVRYRPESFWAANSTITVKMDLFGVDLGNGQIGNFSKTNTVHIGDKRTAVADAQAHTFTAYINDQPVHTWPATLGDTRFPSARGYLVLMEKQRKAHFVAASIGLKPGDPANYGELDVEYATRLTPSGEFIHQATDTAMPYLGQINVSHGCIGLGPDGASWVFNNMTAGDVVQIINTQGDFANFDDGFGDWNIPWAQYANS